MKRKVEVSSMRYVGILAIAYATSVFVQNVIFVVSAGSPSYGDPMSKVLDYHANNQETLAITSGLEAVNMVLLLVFLVALHNLVKSRGGQGEAWSRLAMVAGATFAALSAVFYASHIAVIVAASSFSESNAAFQMMWQFHAATFALAFPALGLTSIGTTFAAHANGLTRPWQSLLGVVGGILPIVGGLGNVAVARGSNWIATGVIGLFLWLVWLIASGIGLLRGRVA